MFSSQRKSRASKQGVYRVEQVGDMKRFNEQGISAAFLPVVSSSEMCRKQYDRDMLGGFCLLQVHA